MAMIGKLVLITVGCIVGGFVLAGLPGGIVLALSSPAIYLVHGDFFSRLPGDALWPIAIFLTVLWPLGIVPVHLVQTYLLDGWLAERPVLAWALLLWGWGALCSVVVVGWALRGVD